MKLKVALDSVYAKGDRVVGRVKKNEWYTGTVKRVSAAGVLVIFDDGFKATVEPSDFKHLRPLTKNKKLKRALTDDEVEVIASKAKRAPKAAKTDDSLIRLVHNRGEILPPLAPAKISRLFLKNFPGAVQNKLSRSWELTEKSIHGDALRFMVQFKSFATNSYTSYSHSLNCVVLFNRNEYRKGRDILDASAIASLNPLLLETKFEKGTVTETTLNAAFAEAKEAVKQFHELSKKISPEATYDPLPDYYAFVKEFDIGNLYLGSLNEQNQNLLINRNIYHAGKTESAQIDKLHAAVKKKFKKIREGSYERANIQVTITKSKHAQASLGASYHLAIIVSKPKSTKKVKP